ncbi:MAG: glycosyltransferase [Clostridiales bacterium]|nr:glycosyltransferase [Clostridiales bacterium]
MKPRVCFVVQRYGLEVNGGAELHCRQIAQHLKPYCDIEVLTTKAIDYMTWQDEYKNDEEDIEGIKVRRFSVSHPRCVETFNRVNQHFNESVHFSWKNQQLWIDEQGPYVPALTDYIGRHKDDYDVFVFFTYLYYTTVMGVPVVNDKAIVVPDAHDEPFLRMKIFERVFRTPKALFFNTYDEMRLVHKKYYNHYIKYEIGGAGVDVPSDVDSRRFKEKYGIDRYIIYVGRIDEGKNCPQLFRDFIDFKEKHPSDLKLVLMGKEVVPVPEHPDILSLGFVSEQDKFDGIAGAKLLVLPSRFESLSIVVLEAFSLNVPVLVNGECEVLKAHCVNSNAGLYYCGSEEFEQMLHDMLADEQILMQLGENGHRYVEDNYQWSVVISKLYGLIRYVMEQNVMD